METTRKWLAVLTELKAGNERFVAGTLERGNLTEERRRELTAGQKPKAVILGCSDSRVPPELIFDQGLGDLFVIRVAGNVLDDLVLASLEYAAVHLQAPLIVVLGHSNCGAVTAAVAEDVQEGHLHSLMLAIETAEPDEGEDFEGRVEKATRANVRNVAEGIRRAKHALGDCVRSGKLAVIEAYYDMESGAVEFME